MWFVVLVLEDRTPPARTRRSVLLQVLSFRRRTRPHFSAEFHSYGYQTKKCSKQSLVENREHEPLTSHQSSDCRFRRFLDFSHPAAVAYDAGVPWLPLCR